MRNHARSSGVDLRELMALWRAKVQALEAEKTQIEHDDSRRGEVGGVASHRSFPAVAPRSISRAGGCFDTHGPRDWRGPSQRTVLSDEGVDLGRHLGREGGDATGSQVRMSVHALEERGEHAPGLVYHEHHIMEKLQAPREDAGPDHHGVPDTHFGGIPEVMLEIEAARARRREVLSGEPQHRVHRVPRLVVDGQVPAHVHVAVPVLVGGRDHCPVNRRQRRELIERDRWRAHASLPRS